MSITKRALALIANIRMKRWHTRITSNGVTLAALVMIFVTCTRTTQAATGINSSRPNILVIMTDDQDYRSVTFPRPDGTKLMLKVDELLANEGVSFTRYFNSFSICCPSRATFLTGQYAHNHGVLGNELPTGGYGKLNHSNTLPVWLQNAGYHTALIGKYLNNYGRDDTTPHDELPACKEVPPGWSNWQGSVDRYTYRYYNFIINENGRLVFYGTTVPSIPTGCELDELRGEEYQTDLYTRKAVAHIHERASEPEPFFLWLSYLAPHSESYPFAPTVPRSEHLGFFNGVGLPRPPSFNEANVSDKPSFIRSLSRFSSSDTQKITTEFRRRYESLLAVDDGVDQIVQALKDSGQYDNTVIIFVTDNGFFHGEHRIKTNKNRAYEESTRAPLIVVGPEFSKDVSISRLTVNCDLAPTIVELANATAGLTTDGRSLVPLLRGNTPGWRSAILFEHEGGGNPSNKAVRTPRYVYVEHANGEKEFYDLHIDPYQLMSRHLSSSYAATIRNLKQKLDALRGCAGSECQR